ncbi:MAG: hypothetical protein J6D54_02220 [Olsenella sp.]|nr:hypothetical protein [Olsenella sp.]
MPDNIETEGGAFEPVASFEKIDETASQAEGASDDTPSRGEATSPTSVASGALGSLKDGLDAIGAVRSAAKQHSDARAQLKRLKKELAKTQSVLDHRTEIESRYDEIVSEKTAEIEDARRAILASQERAQQLEAEKSELEGRLQQMKAEHETAIRPYRDLMESTKGRSDDAAKSLAEIRRAVKNADQQVADAAKRREQRIANANRAVDNAQERLRKVESELSSLQSGGNASPSAIQKMQSEVVTERAHLDAARDEVTRTTAECQQLVDNAQTHLWTQKQSLETVERQANEAKRESDAHREEYERLYNSALAEEKALEEDISLRKKSIDEANKERIESERLESEAQALLDEANDIHATPEVTQQLKQGIEDGEAALERQESEVNSLAQSERRLREATRAQRFVFIGVAVAVLIVIALLIWFFAIPH